MAAVVKSWQLVLSFHVVFRMLQNCRKSVEHELSMVGYSNNELIRHIGAQTDEWYACKCTKTWKCDKQTDG